MTKEQEPATTELNEAELDQIQGGAKLKGPLVRKTPVKNDALGNFEIQDLMSQYNQLE